MSETIDNPACADMELRDYIATAVLPAVINWSVRRMYDTDEVVGWTTRQIAEHAYDFADAMLAARSAGGGA